MERRNFIQNITEITALSTFGLDKVLSFDVVSPDFENKVFALLKSWCDGLINQQINDPSDPARHGAIYCVASKSAEQVNIQKGKRISIAKREGSLKVESKTKFTLTKDFPTRRFNLVPGFEVLPISVSFSNAQKANIKIIINQ